MRTLTAEELENIKARALAMHGVPVQELEFTDADLDCEIEVMPLLPDLPVKPPPVKVYPPRTFSKGRTKVSIRLPSAVVDAFKAKAKDKSTGYQTLISKTLKEASEGW